MKSFQLVMYMFYAAMALGVVGVAVWFFRNKKERR